MRLDISDIVKTDGASLEVDVSQAIPDINTDLSDYILDNPIAFKGKITNNSGILKLEGHISTKYKAKCFRCLEDLERQIDIDVREDFVDARNNTDSETYTYESNFVEIDKVLKDNIILNLPMRQLCKDECKGMCQKCGNNLNEKDCSCQEESLNPQMEALKNFFNN